MIIIINGPCGIGKSSAVELVRIQEAAARNGDLGYVVDTTTQASDEVADVIWGLIHDSDFTDRYREVSCAS